MVYLDFSKAFDSVPHRRLLLKLESYGVGGQVLKWIQNFLTYRKQRVSVGEAVSSWAEVHSGVPQGSVLGPVLFVCYINDMPDMIKSFIYMYADDAKVGRRVSCDMDREALQMDLDKLGQWSSKWQLRFNVDKCKVMHMGRSNMMAKYSMQLENGGTYVLQETKEEKDLGIWMDTNLKFSGHVTHAVNKANQLLGLIRRSFTYLDILTIKQLYTAMVRPHLEYGNVVWHPRLKKDVKLLEKIQHRATKMVPALKKLKYEDRLKRMNLPSLAYRRLRGDAIETFKFLQGIYMVNSCTLLPLSEKTSGVTTRGHSMKLLKRDCKTAQRANILGFRIVNFWNSLPDEVVNADSVNAFKNRFDRHCRHISFCSEDDLWTKLKTSQ
jgi:ribonuclease P/MRP protein subunit RPP40